MRRKEKGESKVTEKLPPCFSLSPFSFPLLPILSILSILVNFML